jgi:hypothetical protein
VTVEYRIAIQPETQKLTSGRTQSFSDDWIESLRASGHEPVLVNAAKPEFFGMVRECDGFMWWFGHLPYPRRLATRVVQALQHGTGMPIFPSWETIWHFDDKIGQYFLLQAAAMPTPTTWTCWSQSDALSFCREARYPLVLKLAGGITSENVRLLEDADEAEYWVRRLFASGTVTLTRPKLHGLRDARVRIKDSLRLLLKGVPPSPSRRSDIHKDYLLVQEFLPGNEFDTRITVIGKRAFAFRRFNRPHDFRASGSGRIDWDPTAIDIAFVRLAFRAGQYLKAQSVAVDGMYDATGKHVLVEISYYYEGWAVHDCPGHWELSGSPESGELTWVEGSVRPQDAILEDFLELIARRHKSR